MKGALLVVSLVMGMGILDARAQAQDLRNILSFARNFAGGYGGGAPPDFSPGNFIAAAQMSGAYGPNCSSGFELYGGGFGSYNGYQGGGYGGGYAPFQYRKPYQPYYDQFQLRQLQLQQLQPQYRPQQFQPQYRPQQFYPQATCPQCIAKGLVPPSMYGGPQFANPQSQIPTPAMTQMVSPEDLPLSITPVLPSY